MRVAFTPFVDPAWTGGIHYMRNLFSVLAELPEQPLEPVLFRPPDAPESTWKHLLPFLKRPPVIVPSWGGGRARRVLLAMFRGRDAAAEAAFRRESVDLVFVNDTWFGHRFELPTLAWIADFQHCHLPAMFSRRQRWMRSAKFGAYCRYADRVMVSSLDGKRDCETFFPSARGRVHEVPFAVEVAAGALETDAVGIAEHHGLPEKFFFLPGQMWRHKNHLALIDALALLKNRGLRITVAASGHAADVFRPGYPAQVFARIAHTGLQDQVRFLGHLPYANILSLMRRSAAVVNPSLFEGWSTPVEEAKALGVPLVLSGLRVHREQAPPGTSFFDPNSIEDIAKVLADAWVRLEAGPRLSLERAAYAAYRLKRQAFAQQFLAAAQAAHQGQAAPGRD